MRDVREELPKRRITIIVSRQPKQSPSQPQANNLNDEIQWFAQSLGLFGPRDRDRSCFRIFVELLKTTREDLPLSSDEIGYRLNLSRGTVVHHINKLMDTGIVISQRDRYLLRVDSLERLMDELEQELDRACEQLKRTARDIDSALGRRE